MTPEQRQRFELLANGDIEPDNEIEMIFMTAAQIGASLKDPVSMYSSLRRRFPEVKSDAVEAMCVGYDYGICAAQAARLELDGMNVPVGDEGSTH
jgi:hypothetical protein